MDTELAGAAAFCDSVGRKIVAATRSADQAVLDLTGCIAAIVEGRQTHDLNLDVAMHELQDATDALSKVVTARTAINKTRMRLVRWPARLGVEGYGTGCPCNNPGVTALRSVA